MNQETLTRHLFTLGYFTLEWRGNGSGSAMAGLAKRIARALSEAMRPSFLTGFGRSV